ncbi:MAG: TRAP transporter substrate-binding protein DctP [Halorhodospira sp.]
MRRAIIVATMLLGCLALAAPLHAAEQWRVALEEVEGSIQHRYAERFAERIEAQTDGEVEVEILPYGTIGEMGDIYEQLQSGAVQFAFGSGALGGTVPESQLFSVNFVLSDDEYVNTRALNDPTFLRSEPLQEAYRERGMELISVLPEGWQVWSANKPIRSPADFDGVQMRTMDNRLLRETYRQYGADPTPMAYSEIYGGLEQGVIDGNIQPFFAHQEMGFYEVQDYFIEARQAQFIAGFMASSPFFQSLSEAEREMVREVTAEMVDWAHEMQQEVNQQRLTAMQEASDIEVIQLEDEERDAFRERAESTRTTFVDEVGARGEAALERLLEAVERARQEHGDG